MEVLVSLFTIGAILGSLYVITNYWSLFATTYKTIHVSWGTSKVPIVCKSTIAPPSNVCPRAIFASDAERMLCFDTCSNVYRPFLPTDTPGAAGPMGETGTAGTDGVFIEGESGQDGIHGISKCENNVDDFPIVMTDGVLTNSVQSTPNAIITQSVQVAVPGSIPLSDKFAVALQWCVSANVDTNVASPLSNPILIGVVDANSIASHQNLPTGSYSIALSSVSGFYSDYNVISPTSLPPVISINAQNNDPSSISLLVFSEGFPAFFASTTVTLCFNMNVVLTRV